MLDQSSLGLLGLGFLFVLVHGWTAYAATVLSNVRRVPLVERAEAGDPVARRILKLSDNFSRFAATVLVVQWFCRVGMTASMVFALGVPLRESSLAADGSPWPLALFLVLLIPGTLLALWLSQTLPTALGAARADQDAPLVSLVAGPMMGLMRPFVSATFAFSRWTSRLVGAEGMDKAVTEEEIIALVDSGQRGGAIETEEKEMIYSVLQFGETLVREVMVPRPDIVALPLDLSVQAALKVFIDSGHSRAPIFEDDLDEIEGILYAKDLLTIWHSGQTPGPLSSLARPAYFVPETKRADVLFKEMQQRKIHIAIVVDEYGGTAGLVTIEDLLEEIVGDIRDEFDIHEEADYVQVAEGDYVVDGAMNLGDFNHLLGIDVPDEENDSIGGHIYSLLGRVPQIGEVVDDPEHRLRMIIESVSNRRIRKVHVSLLPEMDETADEADEPDGKGRKSTPAKTASDEA